MPRRGRPREEPDPGGDEGGEYRELVLVETGFAGEDAFTFLAGDGTAESNVATVAITVTEKPTAPLVTIVSVSTGKPYALGTARLDEFVYIDRSYRITSITSGVDGHVLVRTANNDKKVKAENHLVLRLGGPARLYVCYDRRASSLPNWLSSWTLTSESVSTSHGSASPMRLYSKAFAAGDVTLGGNGAAGAAGAAAHYLVVVTAAGTKAAMLTSAPDIQSEWYNEGDTDGDGLLDWFELEHGFDPDSIDTDGDGEVDESELDPSTGLTYWELQEQALAAGTDSGSALGCTGVGVSGDAATRGAWLVLMLAVASVRIAAIATRRRARLVV